MLILPLRPFGLYLPHLLQVFLRSLFSCAPDVSVPWECHVCHNNGLLLLPLCLVDWLSAACLSGTSSSTGPHFASPHAALLQSVGCDSQHMWSQLPSEILLLCAGLSPGHLYTSSACALLAMKDSRACSCAATIRASVLSFKHGLEPWGHL